MVSTLLRRLLFMELILLHPSHIVGLVNGDLISARAHQLEIQRQLTGKGQEGPHSSCPIMTFEEGHIWDSFLRSPRLEEEVRICRSGHYVNHCLFVNTNILGLKYGRLNLIDPQILHQRQASEFGCLYKQQNKFLPRSAAYTNFFTVQFWISPLLATVDTLSARSTPHPLALSSGYCRQQDSSQRSLLWDK